MDVPFHVVAKRCSHSRFFRVENILRPDAFVGNDIYLYAHVRTCVCVCVCVYIYIYIYPKSVELEITDSVSRSKEWHLMQQNRTGSPLSHLNHVDWRMNVIEYSVLAEQRLPTKELASSGKNRA